MKKSIFTASALAALAISTVFTVAIGNATTSSESTGQADKSSALISESNLSPTPSFISSDESVFIIADHAGTPTKSFIGSDLNISTTKFPFDIHITYSLDGNAISAQDLLGKSGHVQITYSIDSTKAYQDKLIPFLAVTGLDLDPAKFSNVHIDHGKIVKESASHLIVTGITLPGLNQDLGTDFLPDSFTLTADVKDFAINDSYTLITNDLFSDIDTSKLDSLSSIVDAINQLSSSLDQIIAGSTSLTDGLDSALAGAKKLQSGIDQVNTGANSLASGANELSTGAHSLASGAKELSTGLEKVVTINDQIMARINPITSTIDSKIADIEAEIAAIEVTDPDLAAELTRLLTKLTSYYTEATTAVNQYVDGIESLANGAKDLSAGAEKLASGTDSLATGANTLATGTKKLASGTDSLVDGLSKLDTGSHTLTSGLNSFKSQGISRLTDFANHDLDRFTTNLRQTITAAKSYHHYQNPSAKTVKFIIKTPSL